MQSRKWERKQRKNRGFRAILSVFISLCLLILTGDILFSKAIRRTLDMQGEILAATVMSEVIAEQTVTYPQLCDIHYSCSGTIESVVCNASAINQLLSEIEYYATKRLSETKSSVSIPLGTLLGIEVFSAQGPEIPLTVRALGAVRLEYKSEFSSAGINQTRHRIVAAAEIRLNTYVPFYSEDIVFSKMYCLAETILIGEVPDISVLSGTA